MGVGFHGRHAQIRIVLRQHVGTADRRVVLRQPEGIQILVGHVVNLDGIGVRGGDAPVENGVRHRQRGLHRAVVQGRQAGYGIRLVGAGFRKALHVADVLRDAAVFGQGVRHPVPGTHDLLRGDGRAVRPPGPFVDGEGPDRIALAGRGAVEDAVLQLGIHVKIQGRDVQQGHPALVVAAAAHGIEGKTVGAGRTCRDAQHLFVGRVGRPHGIGHGHILFHGHAFLGRGRRRRAGRQDHNQREQAGKVFPYFHGAHSPLLDRYANSGNALAYSAPDFPAPNDRNAGA